MPSKPQMWMVRADEGGRLFDEFKTQSIVAIGFTGLNDLSALKTREDFTRAATKAWPDLKRMQIAVAAGQAYRFAHEIKIGDRILTYDPSTRSYLVGTVSSDYTYKPGSKYAFANVRDVKWEGTVSRDRVSVSTRNSLGAISTLFLVPAEAAEDIENQLRHPDTPSLPPVPAKEDEENQVDAIYKNSQRDALEFIKDRISRLDWEEMQHLV